MITNCFIIYLKKDEDIIILYLGLHIVYDSFVVIVGPIVLEYLLAVELLDGLVVGILDRVDGERADGHLDDEESQQNNSVLHKKTTNNKQ